MDKDNNNNITIESNTIINGGWDAIVIRSNSLVENNYINGTWHHGIDTLISDAGSSLNHNGTIIRNNTIDDPIIDDPSYDDPNICILTVQ